MAPRRDRSVTGSVTAKIHHGGPWSGRKCIGCSLAVGPEGQVLARGPYGADAQELIVVDVEISPRRVTGTDLAPMLRRKGYEGP